MVAAQGSPLYVAQWGQNISGAFRNFVFSLYISSLSFIYARLLNKLYVGGKRLGLLLGNIHKGFFVVFGDTQLLVLLPMYHLSMYYV
jgi:hypothetical protein